MRGRSAPARVRNRKTTPLKQVHPAWKPPAICDGAAARPDERAVGALEFGAISGDAQGDRGAAGGRARTGSHRLIPRQITTDELSAAIFAGPPRQMGSRRTAADDKVWVAGRSTSAAVGGRRSLRAATERDARRRSLCNLSEEPDDARERHKRTTRRRWRCCRWAMPKSSSTWAGSGPTAQRESTSSGSTIARRASPRSCATTGEGKRRRGRPAWVEAAGVNPRCRQRAARLVRYRLGASTRRVEWFKLSSTARRCMTEPGMAMTMLKSAHAAILWGTGGRITWRGSSPQMILS